MTVIQGGQVIPSGQQRVFQQGTITVGAEAANVINVAVQLQEGGNNLTERASLLCYLSGDAQGDGLLATAPTGGTAIGTNGTIIQEIVADTLFLVTSNATGAFDVDITDVGTPTMYLIVVLPNGKLAVSTAITFA